MIARDKQTLTRLEITADAIAGALDRLLDAARATYGKDEAAFETFPVDEIEQRLSQGELPPEQAGLRAGDLQVFVAIWAGYQFCPWTALRRPWSSLFLPGTPVRIIKKEKTTIITTVTGVALPCRKDLTYRYADCDFLIINRATGEHLSGPGFIVHLIRDHGFFEGTTRYRVDPERAARVLGLHRASSASATA